MLKKISVEDLRLGMFIHAFCGSWMEHPFWRDKFLLKNPKDLQRIQESAVNELWIDVSRGLNIEDGQVAQSEVEASAEVDAQLRAAVEMPTPQQRVNLDEELQRAARVCSRAKTAVLEMFSDVRMGKAIDSEQAQEMVEEISCSILRHPNALISLARLKTADEYTYMHSVAVCALMISLARQLNLPESIVREAGMAGLLHDIGKMVIPNDILNKPGKLTDAEFDTIKTHPDAGTDILRNHGKVSALVLDVCLHHHEKMDGTGYPHHLKGDQLSLLSKMGAVCDVYDAITSDRPYKKGWTPAESIRRMAEWTKGHFDPMVFQAFVKSVGIYPTGSLVRLSSGRLGVVLEQHEKSLLTPCVKVFFSARSRTPIPQVVVDLSKVVGQEQIVARELPEDWGFRNLENLWSGAH